MLVEAERKLKTEILENDQLEKYENGILRFRMYLSPKYEELTDPEVAKRLGLSSRQISKLKKIASDAKKEIYETKLEAAKKWYEKLKDTLSREQKDQIEKNFGKIPDALLLYLPLLLDD